MTLDPDRIERMKRMDRMSANASAYIGTIAKRYAPQLEAVRKTGFFNNPEIQKLFLSTANYSEKFRALQRLAPSPEMAKIFSDLAEAVAPIQLSVELIEKSKTSAEFQARLDLSSSSLQYAAKCLEENWGIQSALEVLRKNKDLFDKLRPDNPFNKATTITDLDNQGAAEKLQDDFDLGDFFDVEDEPKTPAERQLAIILLSAVARLFSAWQFLMFLGLTTYTFPAFVSDLLNTPCESVEQTQKNPCIPEGPNKRLKIVRSPGKDAEENGEEKHS
jgi:hypothetical protein